MADPYKDNVVLYLPFEGSSHGDTVILDKLGNSISKYNNAALSTSVAPPFGTTSLATTGSTYGIYVTNGISSFGTKPFTIEFWFYATATGNQFLFDTRPNGSSTYGGGLSIGLYSSTALGLFISGTLAALGTNVSLNTWYHVACVRTSYDYIQVFLNGKLDISYNIGSGTSINIGSARPLICGAGDSYTAWVFSGYFKDLRITKNINRYPGNFFVSQTTTVDDDNWGNVVLAIHGEGTGTTFTDVSNSAKTITTNGNTIHSTAVAPPFGSSSIYFDGTGDYLSVSNALFSSLGTDDFTIELWFNPAASMSSVGVIAVHNSVAAYTQGWVIQYDGSAETIACGVGDNSGGYNVSHTSSAITPNIWHHVALVRRGTDFFSFLDGVIFGTSTGQSFSVSDVGTDLCIGINSNKTGAPYTGYIKDLRITKGVARYTQNFNPRRVNDPYYKDTVLLLTGEGSGTTFVDQSPINNTVTLYYDTTHSTTVTPPFGSSSIYFDGTQDWLSVPKSNAFNFGTNDFTVEMWVYLTQYPGTSYVRSIWSTGKTSGPDYYSTRISVADTYKLYATFSTNGTTQTSLADTENFPLNTWVHVALERYNGNITLYKNGSIVTYSSISGSVYYSTADPVSIAQDHSFGGTGYDNRWKGYMKNIVVTNGSARYKGMFTPKLYTTLNRLNGAPVTFPDKTTIKTIAKPIDWDIPEQPRILI